MSLIHRRESQSSPDDYCFLAVIHFLHKKLLTTWFDLLMFQNQRKPLCLLLHRSVTKTHEQVEGLVLSDFLAVLFMEVFGFQLCRVTLPSALCGIAACSHFLFLLSFSIFVSLPYSLTHFILTNTFLVKRCWTWGEDFKKILIVPILLGAASSFAPLLIRKCCLVLMKLPYPSSSCHYFLFSSEPNPGYSSHQFLLLIRTQYYVELSFPKPSVPTAF